MQWTEVQKNSQDSVVQGELVGETHRQELLSENPILQNRSLKRKLKLSSGWMRRYNPIFTSENHDRRTNGQMAVGSQIL